MTNKDTSGPAFPTSTWGDEAGMTLRDYFAAKAMQEMIRQEMTPEDVADAAYEYADALLKARDEQ